MPFTNMKNFCIALIEPFFGGSHRAWAEGLKRHSQCEIELFGLSDRFWKWRMHGGAVTLAHMLLESQKQFDLILASDMLDASVFLAQIRQRYPAIPIVLYMHENQLTYPWSPTDPDVSRKRDVHYGYINYTSALAAEAVLFNSDYHRVGFLDACESMLRRFPDHQNLDSLKALIAKSRTLHLGLDLSFFDSCKPLKAEERPPLILWNHRWEYDKNPEGFFRMLFVLAAEGLDFEVAVLGECYSDCPEIFKEAEKTLNDRLLHFGFCESREAYAAWLWRADILPVTSCQDFFGISIVEACYCGAIPLLPNRLSYPELLPPKAQNDYLYDSEDELLSKMRGMLKEKKEFPENIREHVAQFDWKVQIKSYDHCFQELLALTRS